MRPRFHSHFGLALQPSQRCPVHRSPADLCSSHFRGPKATVDPGADDPAVEIQGKKDADRDSPCEAEQFE
jgi:hypothetical protein